MKTTLKAVTYNIHRAVGLDRRYDPSRIVGVLAEIKADIIGLQEVDTGLYHERLHQLDYFAKATGYNAVEGPVIKQRSGQFGNALLSRHPIRSVRRIDLTVRGARRRGALDVDLEVHGKSVRVFVAHLGLGPLERYVQVRRILKALDEDLKTFTIIMGDFNILSTQFKRFRKLQARMGHPPLVRTFPAILPLLPLDRLWVEPSSALRALKAHSTPLSRTASDHLPLVGTLEL